MVSSAAAQVVHDVNCGHRLIPFVCCPLTSHHENEQVKQRLCLAETRGRRPSTDASRSPVVSSVSRVRDGGGGAAGGVAAVELGFRRRNAVRVRNVLSAARTATGETTGSVSLAIEARGAIGAAD